MSASESYLQFIIKQYYYKPKARAEALLMLEIADNFEEQLAIFYKLLDVDEATGSALDVIGKIVGLPRQVNAVIPVRRFGFSNNINALGFNQAPFYSLLEDAYTPLQLQDEEYRRFIKIKIQKNIAKPYLAGDGVTLQSVVVNAFDGGAFVVDNKNHTLTLYVDESVDQQELAVILNLDLIPRPLTFEFNVIQTFDRFGTFGFSNNPNAVGFNNGKFSQIIG